MSRIVTASVFSFLWLTSSQCFGQARDRRLDDAVVDITLLKRLLMEQDRRIADLEKLVRALQTAQAATPPKPAVEERVAAPVRSPAARWKNPLIAKIIGAVFIHGTTSEKGYRELRSRRF